MDYVIVMDVAGYIDLNIANKNDVRFIPMEYTIGDTIRMCNGPEDHKVLAKFYNGQRNGDLTKTSQISPYQYEDFFKKIFEEKKSVLYLCLSSGLSSTYHSACIAKQSLTEAYPDCSFYPLDTLAATGGMGVIAERAINNRNKGMTIEENFNDLTNATKKVEHWFMVDDLAYLKRGGRISASTAIVGTALNVKPILIINQEGKLETVSKKRGNNVALNELSVKFSERFDNEADDAVYIIHADCIDKANHLYEQIKGSHKNIQVRICGLSPIIGAHTGPGMVAICFMRK